MVLRRICVTGLALATIVAGSSCTGATGRKRAGGASVSPSPSTSPRATGRIAFFQQDSGTYVVNADGTGEVKIADSAVEWSHDSTKFAVMRPQAKGIRRSGGLQPPDVVHWYDVYAANADGSNPRLIKKRARGPLWSPDDTMLAFTVDGPAADNCSYCEDWQVWVAGSDGSGARQLTRSSAEQAEPFAWSHDSRMIAYLTTLGDVVTVRPDGTDRRVVVKGVLTLTDSFWSTDSTHLVYQRAVGSGNSRDLFVSRADGRAQTRLGRADRFTAAWVAGDHLRFEACTDGSCLRREYSPARGVTTSAAPANPGTRSPDGSVFVRGEPAQNGNGRSLVLADASGATIRALTKPEVGTYESQEVWSPDGHWIAFVRAFPGAPQGYVVGAYVVRVADGFTYRLSTRASDELRWLP